MNSASLRAVLLDRDGVINFDSDAFIKSAREWRPIPGALEAVATLQQHFEVAVCTNQSGLGRGLLSDADLADIHRRMLEELIRAGGRQLDIYFCPHLPDDGCHCRKPEPGLLHAAMQPLGVAADQVVFVGDSIRDLQAAGHAGCHAALVLTGNGAKTLEESKTSGLTGDFSVHASLADLTAKLCKDTPI